MYSKILNVQIILSLMKQHGIKHIVLSAGTRHVPIAHSAENDPYFKCYSVVDERSAAYYALGLAKELNEPVAIACTSSTATCNYVPGIAEAYYQHVPLLVLTGDRDPYRLGQLEDQMINQVDMYKNFCKKCVNLPIVENDNDKWYCTRLVNEAMLELTRHGNGPVQINFPINQTIQEIADASAPELPVYNHIERIEVESGSEKWKSVADKLLKAKKILVVCGSDSPASSKQIKAMESFAEKYNCVIATEYFSNINCKGSLNTYLVAEAITATVLKEIGPDIVIFFGGNFISRLKVLLRNIKGSCESWCITDDGVIVDPFQNLTKVFECSRYYFFDRLAELAGNAKNDMVLYNELEAIDTYVKNVSKTFTADKESICAFGAMRELAARIPSHSLLHTGILHSSRIMQMFPLRDDITAYSNIGTDGIDGSMSTFYGQAAATDRECYLVIGDLSFFYDMNSVGIRNITNNTHILLVNNGGGAEFYFSMGPKWLPNIDMHISASHSKKAEEWVKANGFTYMSAHTIEEYESKIDEFVKTGQESPILFEVFTDKGHDVDVLKEYRNAIHYDTEKRSAAAKMVKTVEKIPGVKLVSDSKLGKSVKEQLKKLL